MSTKTKADPPRNIFQKFGPKYLNYDLSKADEVPYRSGLYATEPIEGTNDGRIYFSLEIRPRKVYLYNKLNHRFALDVNVSNSICSQYRLEFRFEMILEEKKYGTNFKQVRSLKTYPEENSLQSWCISNFFSQSFRSDHWILKSRRVCFEMEVRGEYCPLDPPLPLVESKVLANLGERFASGRGSDFTVVVGSDGLSGGKRFPVHKLILATRSPVFDKMFDDDHNNGTLEASTNQMHIDDFEPVVVEHFLRFLYTGQLPADPAEMDRFGVYLFIIADKYLVEELKQLCANHMATQLTADTVRPMLKIAKHFQALDLAERCERFIIRNRL